MTSNRPIVNNLVLLAFVILLFFLNFYSKTLFYRPSSIHQWRQTDCLSIAKNYYEEGMNFFQPKIHFQGAEDGKAVSEFPILNYTVAALWKVFGEHEFIYRLLEYLIFLCAMFFLYNTIIRFYGSVWLAFFSAGLFFTSPLLTYYSLNFIADVPAMSVGLIGFCCGLKFYHTGNLKSFYWALGLGTLAVLMKASALMGLSILIFCAMVDIFNLNKFFGLKKLFSTKTAPLVSIIVAAGAILAWYRYALYYNAYDSNHVFLLTVLPIWEMGEEQLIYNLKKLFNDLFPVFLNRPMFFLFIGLVIYVASKFKKIDAYLRLAFLSSGLYFIFYILFFFQVFTVHDYYLTNLMIFPAITLICFAQLMHQSGALKESMAFVRAFVIVVMAFNALYSAAIYRLRMIEDDKMTYWYPFISDDDAKLAKYLFWAYGNGIGRIEDIKPVLRAHGIKREDKVLSIPDMSFDISLYFMDQKGYTIAREHLINDTTVADRFFKRNIKYVVLSDTNLKREIAFRRVQDKLEPFFMYNDKVQVFKVKK